MRLPNHHYLTLKLAHALFEKSVDQLNDSERSSLSGTLEHQVRIETLLLNSREAQDIPVDLDACQTRLNEIRQHHDDEEAFQESLLRHHLTGDSLMAAIENDLVIEAVIERIGQAIEPVQTADALSYYERHPQQFTRPEHRQLRHILLTGEAQEETRHRQQLDALKPTLDSGEAFAAAALRHSHCPTALNGGTLGEVRRGQLYPELEPAAFSLKEGSISEVLASPMGWHLIRCDSITPESTMDFESTREQLMEQLTQHRKKGQLKAWLKERGYQVAHRQ